MDFNHIIDTVDCDQSFKNFPKKILDIAKFIGVDISQETAEKLAGDCSFEAMRKRMESGEGNLDKFRKSTNLIRKGKNEIILVVLD